MLQAASGGELSARIETVIAGPAVADFADFFGGGMATGIVAEVGGEVGIRRSRRDRGSAGKVARRGGDA
jgi:hypothetical protein